MNSNTIHNRANIEELESIFGVRFMFSEDQLTQTIFVDVKKDVFYTRHVMSDIDLINMSDDTLKKLMINLAKDVFDEYCNSLM